MVYGIIELINFAHGDIFMVGAFVVDVVLTTCFGFNGPDHATRPLIVRARHRRSLITMPVMGLVGVASSDSPIGRCGTRPDWRRSITAIGVSFILQNIVQRHLRPVARQYAPDHPARRARFRSLGASISLAQHLHLHGDRRC